MECHKFDKIVSLYIDKMLPRDEQEKWERHLKTCSHCRLILQQTRDMVSMLGMLPEIEPSLDFHRKLRHRLVQEAKGHIKPIGSAWLHPNFVGFTMFLVLMLFCTVIYYHIKEDGLTYDELLMASKEQSEITTPDENTNRSRREEYLLPIEKSKTNKEKKVDMPKHSDKKRQMEQTYLEIEEPHSVPPSGKQRSVSKIQIDSSLATSDKEMSFPKKQLRMKKESDTALPAISTGKSVRNDSVGNSDKSLLEFDQSTAGEVDSNYPKSTSNQDELGIRSRETLIGDESESSETEKYQPQEEFITSEPNGGAFKPNISAEGYAKQKHDQEDQRFSKNKELHKPDQTHFTDAEKKSEKQQMIIGGKTFIIYSKAMTEPMLTHWDQIVLTDPTVTEDISKIAQFEFAIDSVGRVVDVEIIQGELSESNLRLIIHSIKQWQFQPATFNNKPINVLYQMKVNYHIRPE